MRVPAFVLSLICLAAPAVAQTGHTMDHAAMPPGKPPAGWSLRLDNPALKVSDLTFGKMGETFHVMTGPAAIMWRARDVARGAFSASATFKMMHRPTHNEGFGILFAGENLENDKQSYLYFLIRPDGRFMISHRGGADVHAITPWTEHTAIMKPDSAGASTNRLSVDAGTDKIRFLVNGTQVAEFERDKPMTAHGIVGLRINHNLDLHVEDYVIRKQ